MQPSVYIFIYIYGLIIYDDKQFCVIRYPINFKWTDEHDKLLCREILAVDPFIGSKKGTPQRGG